tara:strand:- start:1961 stop:2530 length:570 start_codon:yes stop_codon:yes gene_type:complete
MLKNIADILNKEFELTPEEAINITLRRPLTSGSTYIDHWGASINNGKYKEFPLDHYDRNSMRIFWYRAALLSMFNLMPEKLREAVKKQQKHLLSIEAIKITNKLASYQEESNRSIPLLERGAMMPVRVYDQHIIPEKVRKEHGQIWKLEQEPLELHELPTSLKERLRNAGLTVMALNLTKLQLINQCLK